MRRWVVGQDIGTGVDTKSQPTALVEEVAGLRSEPAFERLRDQVKAIAGLLEEESAIPMVREQMELIAEVQTDEWWQDVTTPMLERARRRLRDLVQFIEKKRRKPVYSDFEDELGAEIGVELSGFAVGDRFEKFRAKARAFLRAHQDHVAIHKLAAGLCNHVWPGVLLTDDDSRTQRVLGTSCAARKGMKVTHAGIEAVDFRTKAREGWWWLAVTLAACVGCSSGGTGADASAVTPADAAATAEPGGLEAEADGPVSSEDSANGTGTEADASDAQAAAGAGATAAEAGLGDARAEEAQPIDAGDADAQAGAAVRAAPGTCAVLKRAPLTSSGGSAMTPSIVWTGDSYLVVWNDARTGSADVYITWVNPDGSRNAGATDMMVAHSGFVTTGAKVSPLGNGRYLLVWEDCKPTLPDCVDGTSVDALVIDKSGAPQDAIINVTDFADVQRRPYLVSALGGAYAAFRDVVNAAFVAKVVRFTGTGTLAPDTITLDSTSTGLYPYVTSGNGELAVVYARGTSTVQIVLTRLSASLASLRELVVRSGPSIATNPVTQWNGTGWVVAWEAESSGDVLVETALASADASAVGPANPVQNSNSNWPAVASNGKDTVVAYYGFFNDAQIMLARLDNSGQMVGSVIQVSDNTSRARYPAVAYSDQSGDFGVVWPDETSGEIVFAEVECR